MDYGFVHDGRVFTPNGTEVSVTDNADRNAELSLQVLARWETRPDSMLAYYTFEPVPNPDRQYRRNFRPVGRGTVTLWTGETIGSIISARVYSHNFGARMISLRVRGTNGAEYYGRASYDNGSCVQLRRAKR